MLHHRLCIISLPRSGSQYAVELIKKNSVHNYTDLVEPFVKNTKYIVEENGKLKISDNTIFFDEKNRIDYSLKQINYADISQPIIMRIFLNHEVEKKYLDIVQTLNKTDFEFIVLKRSNIEEHLISYVTAQKLDMWNKFDPNIVLPQIRVDNFSDIIWLYNLIKSFNIKIQTLPIKYNTITYETIEHDLSSLFGFVINKNIKIYKQVNPNDCYDHIENSEEVRNFISNLINDKKIL